jgi:hypothetical protein
MNLPRVPFTVRKGKRAGIVLSLVVWGLIVPTPTTGQVPTWVGAKVVTKYKTALRVGSRVVTDGSLFRVYTVERVNGDWFWLVSGSVSGWARSSEVVTVAPIGGTRTKGSF